MGWFRRSSAEVAEQPRPSREAADLAAGPWVDRLVRPCARIDLGPPARSPVASCIGGIPYLPIGTAWPTHDGSPAVFVCQVNFADVPRVPDFPSAGLLQWFVATDEAFGRDDDYDEDLVAAPACRWYPGPFEPNVPSRGVNEGGELPFAIAAGTTLVFTPGRSLPSWEELPADMQELPVWQTVAEAYGDKKSRPQRGYDGIVRSGNTDFDFGLTYASTVGGYVDDLPEGGVDGRHLLMILDFGHLTGYADQELDVAGELWGEPGAMRSGDLSRLCQRWY